MKNLMMIGVMVFLLSSCGSNDQKQIKEPKFFTELKGTSWYMPNFDVVGMTFNKDTITVTIHPQSYLSNEKYDLLASDKDFVVVNVYNDTNNRVFGISQDSPDFIKVSMIVETNDLAGYKEYHNQSAAVMKKRS
ncbi:MAG: hypothetical protein ACRCTQ_06810 [Brevinemataceae bacterium]